MVESADLIFYNKVMDRTAVKQLISGLVAHFGITYTTRVLDQLKTLGFHQATLSAISLGIDDLLAAPSRGWLVEDAERCSNLSGKHHNYGDLHAVEKLRQLIETWYATSEYLKQEMNPNFRMTDPLNPVHMMSFSGARGSTSQVHQLVGMRGLMSDPQGQIIDLPIQSNFREGLSLTEYIISCYGARKGVVDTAVRTSDAGYLTRRLVEVVQRIVVRRMDCRTFCGISINNSQEKKSIYYQKLIGRVLAESLYINERCFATRNQDIGASLANESITSRTEPISIRSPLTCKSMLWICQLCYGWNPTNRNLIEIGEAVGIIAGQSIGEPGTQLTLRTFHTGGVFTGDIAEHVRTSFNGIIKFDESLVYPARTRHGHPAWMCHINLFLSIRSGSKVQNLSIPPRSLLLVRNGQYVESKQVIAEIRAKASPSKEKVRKCIYSDLEGEMHWNTKVRHASKYTHSNIHSVLQTCHIWVLSGNSYNKSDELLVPFHKNQDRIDSLILLSRRESLFLGNKNRLNIFISNLYLFGTNKILTASELTCATFNDSNNIFNSDIVLYGYSVGKRCQNIFLKKECATFILEIRENGVLQNNDIFAILDQSKYGAKESGILKYGTIRIDTTDGNNNFEETKSFRPRYRIVKGGTFFLIPEEIHTSTQTLSSLSIKNNRFVRAGAPITSIITGSTSRLVKIRKGINNICEVRILPGTIHYPNETYRISKQVGILIPPGKELFNEYLRNHWTYLQWITPPKEKPFVLMRPAIEYEIFNESNKKNILNLLGRETNLEIRTVNYILYEDGGQVRKVSTKDIQLIKTCLIVHWKIKYFSGKAHVSFSKIRTTSSSRKFLRISLMSHFIPNEKREENVFNSRYVLRKYYYDKLFSDSKNRLVSEHQGIIRVSSGKNCKAQSITILSPLDLVGVPETNQSEYSITKVSINDYLSTEFFDFCKHPKSSDSMKQPRGTVTNDLLPGRYVGFNKLGFTGTSQNVINLSETQIIRVEVPSNIISQNTPKSWEWYFNDEYNKIHEFFPDKNINHNLFKRSFPLYRTIQSRTLNLGEFFLESFDTYKHPSGQIVGMHMNHSVVRLAKPYLATSGATIHHNYGGSIKGGDTLITLIYERLKSGDIIQGLPKVEQLLEARSVNSVSIDLENSFEDWNSDMKEFIGNFWGFFLSTRIGTGQGQMILVDQIQKVYESQGVHVSDKHIEIIVRQMTSRVITLEDGTIHIFLPGELIESSRARRINRVLGEAILYEPILLGITKASLNTQSFISEASFQETTRVLARAALRGRIDWLKGLKENVILGGIIPAGTGSREVIRQITMEKRIIILGKVSNPFNGKIENTFLCRNVFPKIPATETVHNVLRGSIPQNIKSILSI